MELSTKRLYELVARSIGRNDITQTELANELNVSPQTVNNWEKRGIPPSIAVEAEEKYGASPTWLMKGVGQNLIIHQPEAHEADLISVPVYNKAASMGYGTISDEEKIVEFATVTKAWIRTQFPRITSIDNLAMIPSTGDSMSPTIASGEILWVDTGVNTTDVDGIYAISFGDRFFVKRLTFNPLKQVLTISSDNPLAGDKWEVTEENAYDLIIHGKVLLSWKSVKL
ncbi:XRE family transcriptional regulator [Basilea psittacipulmonis]|uniref:XRE family transcriptional regulator n=1 Tax=Basilea psittacipulmonis TaxID=1472345 RepID=UPI00068DE4F1|nr:XRE family transcriptional regulator [Basilea psittacipulmonis]